MKNTFLKIVVGAFLVLTATTLVFGQEAKGRLTPAGRLPEDFYNIPVILTKKGQVRGVNPVTGCDWTGFNFVVTKLDTVPALIPPVPAMPPATIDNSVNTIATGRSIANGQIFNNSGTIIQNTGDLIFNIFPALPTAPTAPVVLPQPKRGIEIGPFFRVSGPSPILPQGGQFGIAASLHSYGLTAANQTKQFGLVAGTEFYIAGKYAEPQPDGLVFCDTCGVYVPIEASKKNGGTTNIAVFAGIEFQGWGPKEDKPIWLSSKLVGCYDTDFGGTAGIKGLSIRGEVAVQGKLPFEILGQEPVAYIATAAAWHPWPQGHPMPFTGGTITPSLALGVNLIF